MVGLKLIRYFYLCAVLLLGGVFIWPLYPVFASDTVSSPPSYNSSRYLEDYQLFKRSRSAGQGFLGFPLNTFRSNDCGSEFIFHSAEKLASTTKAFVMRTGVQRSKITMAGISSDIYCTLISMQETGFGFSLKFRAVSKPDVPEDRAEVDEDRLDLHQLFLDISPFSSSSKRILRSVSAVRKSSSVLSRFFNYRERPNLRLSHDAVKIMAKAGRMDFTAFAGRPVQIDRDYFDNNSGNEHSFWGLYSVTEVDWTFPQKVDLYYIGLNREQARFDQGTANEIRQTIGTRLSGKEGALDYNFELVFQFGSFGDSTISAYAVTSDTGYTWKLGAESKIRFSLRADIYSGDDDPNNADLNSFNPFFPKGKHISQLAATGLINQRDLHPRIDIQFNKQWSLRLSTLFIWRDSLDDGIYSIANGLLRTGQGSRARYVGTQPEVELKWQVDRHLDIKGIFNFFDAGPFLRETPPGNDIIYLGTMATYRF